MNVSIAQRGSRFAQLVIIAELPVKGMPALAAIAVCFYAQEVVFRKTQLLKKTSDHSAHKLKSLIKKGLKRRIAFAALHGCDCNALQGG